MPYGTRPGRPTPRQQRFIDEYLRTGDARAAALAAGYGPSTVARNAAKLLQVPTIAASVRRELDARAERTRIAADRIVLELARVAFSDISRIADWDAAGRFVARPLAELSDADRAAVARITRHGGHVSVALHDKIRALDTLGKYFKLWGKHAEKIGAGGREVAPGSDLRGPALERARAALRQRIERVVAERDPADRDAALREEALWAAAWRERYG